MRLIDAEALKEKITKDEYESAVIQGFAPQLVDTDVLLDYIDNAPTIEAKPVVYGRNLSADTPSQFECSVCGCEDWDTYTCDVDVYKYCPKCGAQMDEVIV